MRFIYTLLVTLILLSACNRSNNSRREANNLEKIQLLSTNSFFTLDSIDYEVIDEAIFQGLVIPPSLGYKFHNYNQEKFKQRIAGIKSFVLIDSTSLIFNDTATINECFDYIIKKRRLIDSTDIEWIRNIVYRNSEQAYIDSGKINSLPFKIISPQTVRELISDTHGRLKFWSIYSESSLLISVSIPAYNEKRDRAMVYVDHSSSEKSGEGYFIWLTLEKGKWISYDIFTLWVS